MPEMTPAEDIQNIYNLMEERGKILTANQKNIEFLMMSLKGDDYGNNGYGQRIATNEKNIDSLDTDLDKAEKRFNNIYNKIVGISIGVSIAASTLGFLIKNSIVKTKANPIQKVHWVEDAPPLADPNTSTYGEDLPKAAGIKEDQKADTLTDKNQN